LELLETKYAPLILAGITSIYSLNDSIDLEKMSKVMRSAG
jgi:hypothetical protein